MVKYYLGPIIIGALENLKPIMSVACNVLNSKV